MPRKKEIVSSSINPHLPLQHIFGPPLLLDDEDPDAYIELLKRVREHLNPQDILEEIWIQDAVDHSWQIPRLRKMQARLQEELVDTGSHPFPVASFDRVSSNLQRVEHLIALAERRRNASLREIGLYRAVFAERLRASLEDSCSALSHVSPINVRSQGGLEKLD
jgi:hypothetical protein